MYVCYITFFGAHFYICGHIHTHTYIVGFSFDVGHYSWILLFVTPIQKHTRKKREEKDGKKLKSRSHTRNKSEAINEEQNNQTTKQTHISRTIFYRNFDKVNLKRQGQSHINGDITGNEAMES